jgi:hypothetical protein
MRRSAGGVGSGGKITSAATNSQRDSHGAQEGHLIFAETMEMIEGEIDQMRRDFVDRPDIAAG